MICPETGARKHTPYFGFGTGRHGDLFVFLKLITKPLAVAPTGFLVAIRQPAVKAGPRPIDHAFDQTVLQWVHVNVIRTTLEIFLVADRMFIKPSLPHVVFTARLPTH